MSRDATYWVRFSDSDSWGEPGPAPARLQGTSQTSLRGGEGADPEARRGPGGQQGCAARPTHWLPDTHTHIDPDTNWTAPLSIVFRSTAPEDDHYSTAARGRGGGGTPFPCPRARGSGSPAWNGGATGWLHKLGLKAYEFNLILFCWLMPGSSKQFHEKNVDFLKPWQQTCSS